MFLNGFYRDILKKTFIIFFSLCILSILFCTLFQHMCYTDLMLVQEVFRVSYHHYCYLFMYSQEKYYGDAIKTTRDIRI